MADPIFRPGSGERESGSFSTPVCLPVPLPRSVPDDLDAGVEAARAGDALQRIMGRVAEIDGLVSEIAASTREQATGLREVNTAVNMMDQVTQQNAALIPAFCFGARPGPSWTGGCPS
jgi:hypothetical protein